MSDPEFFGMGLQPQDFNFSKVGHGSIRLLGKLDLLQYPPEGVPVILGEPS